MTELSIWHLIAQADPIVKGVMLILLLASIWSWSVIVHRMLLIKQARRKFNRFEDQFWSGIDMTRLNQNLTDKKQVLLGGEAIFQSGFNEYQKLKSNTMMPKETIIGAISRNMRVVFNREMDRLEKGLPALATIGSVSPYVGLFGTVWGIMGSFKALGMVEQATLSMVAPGISEALIATAMGLFVAIPAVVAYNRFSTRVNVLLNDYENFQDEFSGILDRELHSAQKQAGEQSNDATQGA